MESGSHMEATSLHWSSRDESLYLYAQPTAIPEVDGAFFASPRDKIPDFDFTPTYSELRWGTPQKQHSGALRIARGARDIANLVQGQWGGGRVLLLANGFVVKPLQQDIEVGQRALIGRFQGAVVLLTGRFDL